MGPGICVPGRSGVQLCRGLYDAASMGPGICVPGRGGAGLLVRVSRDAASMGPGICVPGRPPTLRAIRSSMSRLQWGRASVCPEGPVSGGVEPHCMHSGFNGAGHLCARKARDEVQATESQRELQWGRASVCPEGGGSSVAGRRFTDAASMGPGICVPGRDGEMCTHLPRQEIASMGPGICVPGRSRGGTRRRGNKRCFNGAGHLCARKARIAASKGGFYTELQWGRASVCPEGRANHRRGRLRGHASMGPGICVPGRSIRGSIPRPLWTPASMGPGICVPGRGSRRRWCPAAASLSFNGAGHLCARKAGSWLRSRCSGSAPCFNGAGHLCARKVGPG